MEKRKMLRSEDEMQKLKDNIFDCLEMLIKHHVVNPHYVASVKFAMKEVLLTDLMSLKMFRDYLSGLSPLPAPQNLIKRVTNHVASCKIHESSYSIDAEYLAHLKVCENFQSYIQELSKLIQNHSEKESISNYQTTTPAPNRMNN